MARSLIGLDIGGGGGRATLLEVDSGRTLQATRPWRFPTAPGTGGLGFDLDLDAIWQGLGEATREVIARAGLSPGDVAGVATTSLRLGNVFVDAEGEPLFAVPNRDARAVVAGLTLGAQHGEALYRTTGRWPFPIFTAARLQWLRAEDPGRFERVARVLSISDWLAARLGGRPVAEPTQANETLLLDLGTRAWSDAWLETLDLPGAILPELVASGTRIGELTAEAAVHFGLRAGTPIGVGGADTQCGLLGAGALAPGDVVAVAGTTVPVQAVVDGPVIDSDTRLWTSPHLAADRWVLESNAGPMGESVDWLARLLFPDSPAPVTRLFAEAAGSEPGARGLLSWFGGQVMNAREMGLPVAPVSLSHLSTADDPSPRRHLARAVSEGLACALRANLEQLASVSPVPLGRLRLTGGLSRSAAFAQQLADVIGDPIQVTTEYGASGLGAALCAGVASGVFADLEAAARQIVRFEADVEPRSETREASEALYRRWNDQRIARVASDAQAAMSFVPFAMKGDGEAVASGGERPRPRILVTSDMDAASLARLRRLGEVEYASFREKMRMLTGPSLVEALSGVSVFITEIDLVDAAALAALPELRIVVSTRGDAVNVDADACTAFGVPVLNAPGRNADAVADLALAFLLMLARKLPQADRFLREPGMLAGDMGAMGRAFSKLRGHELWGKTIGLVGLGAVGRKVALRLRGFGARVVVADPFVSAEQASLVDAEKVSLEALLETSDFVSLHAAVTPATTGLIDADGFARMKPEAFLVNTARAALVDEPALVEALESGRIAGAALDTFAVEPPGSEHPLVLHPRVLTTPHVGGNTFEVAAHQGEIVCGDLERLLGGGRPQFALNPRVLDGFDLAAPRPTPDAATLEALKQGPAPAVTDLQKAKKAGAKQDTVREEASPASGAEASGEAGGESHGDAPADASGPPDAVTRSALRTHMEALIRAFCEGIEGDPSIRAFAADQDVALHFTLTDLDLAFWIGLGPGPALRSALGAPDRRSDVNLSLRSAVLDGMFTGTDNPMEAALSGDLSFTGDAAKAMTLQHLQGDLERLYQAARAAVGAPEGLDALATAAGAPLAGSADAEALRTQMVEVIDELYAAQVITATGGNVSVRWPGEDKIWITPSQLFKGDLRPELMVALGLDGRKLDPGARSPSSEWDMHCAILRAKPEAAAVVHAHAPNATILANTGLPFLPISTEAAFFGEIPRVPFIMPGTAELAQAVADAMAGGWAVLMVNHGLVVAGRSLRRAADMVEIIERSAEVILGCHAVGKPPPVLPAEAVETLRKIGDLVA